MSRACLAVLLLMLVAAWPASAQSLSAVSTVIERKTIDLGAPYVIVLRQAYAAGNVEAMTRIAKVLLADLREQKFGGGCCNYDDDYFEVVFVARDEKGADALARILIHNPDPERAVLPGLKGPTEPLYTVFVDESDSVTFTSSFDLERIENPLIKESGDFLAGVVGKLALPVAAAQKGRVAGVQADGSVKAYPTAVTLMKAAMPHSRAKITEKLRAHEPAAYEGIEARAVYLAQFEGDRIYSPDSYLTCRAFAAKIKDDLITARRAACGLAKPDDGCITALKKAVTDASPSPGSCSAAQSLRIARAFLPMAQAAPRLLAASPILTNVPKRWVSFSLGTAVIDDIDTKDEEPKAKLSNGTIVADTFSKLIVQGIVNVMPFGGYDPERFSPSWQERLRFTFGAAFAPYFGASAGVGVALTRAMAIHGGKAWLWYDTPKGGAKMIDQKPQPPDVDTPFRMARTSTWFYGVTYAFK
jgi:hypothetical protein